jgi:hypothetical protein
MGVMAVGRVRLIAAAIGVTVCAGSCSFSGGAFMCSEAAQCGEPVDAMPDPVDARIDSGTTVPDAMVAPFCDPTDATQRLCLTFEGTVTDGSANGLTVTTTAIGFAAGRVGQAVVVDANSRLEIAEVAALDVGHISIEAWVNLTLPASGRVGIIDNNGQYGFFIFGNGDLRCTPAAGVTVSAIIQGGQWMHVACTYDGTTQIVYVDGVAVGSGSSVGTISTGGMSGTSIAGDNPPPNDRLVGQIDQLRVYSEARTSAQICQAAGIATCP